MDRLLLRKQRHLRCECHSQRQCHCRMSLVVEMACVSLRCSFSLTLFCDRRTDAHNKVIGNLGLDKVYSVQ